ncbi:hypothetical protein EMN47_17020 [Prolixibacteraceae bacterium JC049]|nr:hypothetical protein [Prolixibacteraceae bacterium JC049]
MNSLLEPIDKKTFKLILNEKEFYYTYSNDRIYLIRVLDSSNEINLIKTDLASFSNSKIKQATIDKIKSNSDIENFDVKTILWDLYLILINPVTCEEELIAPELVNMIERDKFVARKFLIQGDGDQIQDKLKGIFEENNELIDLLDDLELIFSNDKSKLLEKLLTSEESKVETEIKKSLGQQNSIKFEDVLNYLNQLQEEYKE